MGGHARGLPPAAEEGLLQAHDSGLHPQVSAARPCSHVGAAQIGRRVPGFGHPRPGSPAVAVAPLPPGGGGAGASWTDHLQSNNAAVTRDLAAVDMYQGVTQGAEAPGGKSEETVRDVLTASILDF